MFRSLGSGQYKWAMLGSNQRPPPCRGGALPAELIALGKELVKAYQWMKKLGRRDRNPSSRKFPYGPDRATLPLASFLATWRSGYAAACKAVDAGSIPAVAFTALGTEL